MNNTMRSVVVPVASKSEMRAAERTLLKIRNICENDDSDDRGAHIATLFVAVSAHAWRWFEIARSVITLSDEQKAAYLRLESGWKEWPGVHARRTWHCAFLHGAEPPMSPLFSLEQAIIIQAARDAQEGR